QHGRAERGDRHGVDDHSRHFERDADDDGDRCARAAGECCDCAGDAFGDEEDEEVIATIHTSFATNACVSGDFSICPLSMFRTVPIGKLTPIFAVVASPWLNAKSSVVSPLRIARTSRPGASNGFFTPAQSKRPRMNAPVASSFSASNDVPMNEPIA